MGVCLRGGVRRVDEEFIALEWCSQFWVFGGFCQHAATSRMCTFEFLREGSARSTLLRVVFCKNITDRAFESLRGSSRRNSHP